MVFPASFDDHMPLVLLSWVSVQSSIVLKKLHLLGGCESLVSEEDHTSLCYKQGKLVQLLIVELVELGVLEQSPNRFSEVDASGDGQ